MRFPRRQLLQLSLALGAALASPWLGAQTASNMGAATYPASGTHSVQVGDFKVTAILDGISRRPMSEGFVRNATVEQAKAALALHGLPTDYLDVPYTVFLVEADGKRYLMDSGFADNGPPGTGKLRDQLAKLNIEPAQIDAVLMSHLHGDHINGLRQKDGNLVYPNATIYIPEPEYAFWMSKEKLDAAPEAARGGFLAVRRVLTDYPADKIKRFTPGDKLLDQFDTIQAFGHSPGHTAIAIGAGKHRFTFLGDTAHFPALFVSNPDWQVQFDMNPEQARTTRQALLNRMAQEGGLVGGYHFPFPSLGHIKKEGERYHFVSE